MSSATIHCTTSDQAGHDVVIHRDCALLRILMARRDLWLGTSPRNSGQSDAEAPCESLAPDVSRHLPDEMAGHVSESIARAIVESAELSAELLGNFLQGISRHLQRCHCETSVQVDDFLYRRLEVVAAVLAELRIPAPGPTHLKRLLLQLVIDPREPVTTELQRFRFVRQESRLRLIQHERDQYSTPAIEVEYECYDPVAVAIHNALEDGPAALWSLRGHLEETCPKIRFVADAPMPGAFVPNDVRALREGIEVNVERRVVTIAGETYAVTEEGANLLSVLIDMGCGEWYSSNEIQAHERGGLCGRIDRTRKALPPEVQRWIETSRNGFRLRRPPRFVPE